MKPEPCMNCKNVEYLYWRRARRVCANCAALNPNWSRVEEHQSVFSNGQRTRAPHPNFMDPINQPVALGTSTPKQQPCVHCTASTYSRYKHVGPRGHKIIFACGWACAGYWMDQKTEEAKLVAGEAYVRRSLGVKS